MTSALVFLITKLPEAWKAVHWTDEVRLLAFKSSEYVTVANVGDGPVYLSHIRIRFPSQPLLADMVHQIGATIAVSTVQSQSLISKTGPTQHQLVLNVADEQWQHTLRQVIESTAAGTRCYEILAFAEGDPGLIGFRDQFGSALRPLRGAGILYWYSPHKRKTYEYTLDAVGLVAKSDGEGCR